MSMKFSFQNICFLKWILPFLSLLVWRLFCFFFFFRFLVSFYFLFYFGAVWVSSANERMLCMLVHNYQRRKSRGVFILIFMGNSLIFCMQKMGTVNKKPKRIKERKRNTKKGRKKKKLLLLYCTIQKNTFFTVTTLCGWIFWRKDILLFEHPVSLFLQGLSMALMLHGCKLEKCKHSNLSVFLSLFCYFYHQREE